MHGRLFFGMLWRLPAILLRRRLQWLRPRGHWSRIGEAGAVARDEIPVAGLSPERARRLSPVPLPGHALLLSVPRLRRAARRRPTCGEFVRGWRSEAPRRSLVFVSTLRHLRRNSCSTSCWCGWGTYGRDDVVFATSRGDVREIELNRWRWRHRGVASREFRNLQRDVRRRLAA